MIGKLRPATVDDSEFCYTLHRQSLGWVIAEVFGGWDDAVQREFHARWFDPARLEIIEDDDATPIGVLDVQEGTDHTYLSRIELLPEYQNRGIGSAVIRDLLTDGRSVRLHVFTLNSRARELYARLGFRVDGEHDGRLEMVAHTGREPRPVLTGRMIALESVRAVLQRARVLASQSPDPNADPGPSANESRCDSVR